MNLLAVAHYLEALDWQRDVIRLHTIFGGKNPHPNFLVGGMASAINLDDTATINAERLTDIRDMITRAQQFVEQVYWPDILAIAGFYKDWAAIGGGVKNYLAVGEFPDGDIRETDDSTSRGASCSSGISPRSGPTTRTRSRSTSPARGTSTPRATRPDFTPTRARPRPSTPARRRRGSTCRTRPSTPG